MQDTAKTEQSLSTFSNALRSHRRSKLMTQAEYAEHIGVSSVSITAWERGVRTPSLAMAALLIKKGVDRTAVIEAVANADTGRAA